MSGAGWRPSPALALRIGEGALAAALIVVAGWGTYRLATPPAVVKAALAAPGPSAAPRADLSILERFDPFSRAAGGQAEGVASAAGGLRLYGVRVASDGRGSAILGTDAAQASYTVGEEVQPGLVLAAVAADHVILDQGGSRQRLEFGALSAPAAYIPPPPPPPPATPAPTPPAPPETPAP